jgi:glycosyltransferase involved in cell wall biosynthesis
MTMSIRYSVVIPAFNAEKTLVACLRSLEQQKPAVTPWEIIVVDDGSTDGTAQIVKTFRSVRYFHQVNQGPAQARNFGVEQARGEIILFIDSDCEACPNWLIEMVRPFRDPEIVGVKGAYWTRQTHWVARFVQREYEIKYAKMKRDRYIDFIDTYSAAFRKTAFQRVGGYDTVFRTASVEDQELSFRLAESGCKMIFNPEARVYHRHVSSVRAYFRKKFKIAFWKVLVVKNHPRKIIRDSHTPQTLKLQIIFLYLTLLAASVGLVLGRWLAWALASAGVGVFILLASWEMRLVRPSARQLLADLYLLGVRSLALGGGLGWGIIRHTLNRFSLRFKIPA